MFSGRSRVITAMMLFLFQYVCSQSRSTISGTVSDQFGTLPGAKVLIEGSDKSTTTDINGFYSFDVDEGSYVLTVNFVMYNTISKSVAVRVGENAILDFVLETGFTIDQPISLGSRSTPSSALKNTAAVDIISPQQIASSGQIGLSHILHYVLPSFHSTNQTISDGTDHIDPATLRGLGPDQVLVLINGKRRHNSALLNVNGTVGRGTVGTDFNSIPIAAIEKIEVLRDGATSQYGSDAIAGVINIVLKEQTDIIAVDNRTGITTNNDGFIIYSSANFGLKIADNGFVNISAEYREHDAINRAGEYTGTVYSNNPLEDERLVTDANFYEQTTYSGQRVMEIGKAKTQDLSLFLNGAIPLSDNAELYLSGGRNYREGRSKGFYRFPKDENSVVLEIFSNGFSPEILTDIQDDAVSAGIRGVKNEWNIDFSHTVGANRLDYTVNNSNNASLGVASPRTFYAGGFVYEQNTTNLDLFRYYNWLRGINLAFGAELRVENYQIIAGEEASYVDGGSTYIDDNGQELPRVPGAQVFPGFRPENELNRFRTNSAAYIDIEANVLEQLLLKTALRYEFYNDFGGQLVWKLSGRYKLSDNFMVRSGYSTGFRAPSLHQVFFQNISTQFVGGESFQVGTFNNESAVVKEAFGVANLKPELSSHFSMGFSGKLGDDFTFAADYYRIDIEDRIVLSGRFSEGYESVLDPFGVGAAQFFTNAIDSRTSGIDMSIEYKADVANGIVTSTLGGNFNATKILGAIKVPQILNGQEEVLFNREEIGRVEDAQPSYKIISQLAFEKAKYRVQLNNSLFGQVTYFHPNDGNSHNWVFNEYTGIIETRDQTFKPKIVTDLILSFQFNNYIKLSLGGNNVLNVFPDKHQHSANTENGNFKYSRRVQQFGLQGANYFAKLLLKL